MTFAQAAQGAQCRIPVKDANLADGSFAVPSERLWAHTLQGLCRPRLPEQVLEDNLSSGGALGHPQQVVEYTSSQHRGREKGFVCILYKRSQVERLN